MAPIKNPRPKNLNDMTVSIAMLEQNAEQTAERFEMLGEKFDRILSKVEELALNSTTLNTRHDTQIQTLQKQMACNEAMLVQTREEIINMSNRISDNLNKDIANALKEFNTTITKLSDTMDAKYNSLDTRVQSIERWRMMLIGGGIVAGAVLMRAFDVVSKFLTK
jgi:hypothetical protein